MPLNRLLLRPEEVDALVLGWLNSLSDRDMDAFFWDYPGIFGYSSAGYGLGLKTARRIVRQRQKRSGGRFNDIQQVAVVQGVGDDKLNDMRVQAREAMALAEYRGIPHEPLGLWQALSAVGSGTSLKHVLAGILRSLSLRRPGPFKAARMKINVTTPFVALARKPGEPDRDAVAAFTRVRVEPWAFAVHEPEYCWNLNVEYFPDRHSVVSVRKREPDAAAA